jgi:multicomponent Na+:H+ antiporter subunit E
VALFVRDFLWRNVPLRILSPCRIAVAFRYFFTWLLVEVKAHLEVAFCVLSGRIKPAIVRVPTKLKTDLGKTMVSNSITLTPGTLTMKAGKNLYVHCLRFEEKPAKSFVHFAEVLE